MPWAETNLLIQANDLVIDDGGAGFPEPSDGWTYDTTNYPDAYNEAQHTHTAVGSPGTGDNLVTWICPVWTDQIDLYITWDALGMDNGSDDARFSVDHGNISQPLTPPEACDQRYPPAEDYVHEGQPGGELRRGAVGEFRKVHGPSPDLAVAGRRGMRSSGVAGVGMPWCRVVTEMLDLNVDCPSRTCDG